VDTVGRPPPEAAHVRRRWRRRWQEEEEQEGGRVISPNTRYLFQYFLQLSCLASLGSLRVGARDIAIRYSR